MTRLIGLVSAGVLYAALALGANAQGALADLRTGDMRKLTLHDSPRPVPDTPFTDRDGAEFTLADLAGRYIVLNFWATWCAPCRHEMPSLEALEAEFGGPAFAVVPIATGRNPLPAIDVFFEETGITRLPVFLDPRQTLARNMGVMGLPLTVILDPEGREIARLIGDADWHSDSARAIIAALIGD